MINPSYSTKYAYVHNLQGDIVAILDSNGTAVVQYKYDAWGKPISKTGSMSSTLGTVQPFRYRGYVYDEETALYYLRSRFYCPHTARFINSDNNILADAGMGGTNIYVYCNNCPISKHDQSGAESTTALNITDTESAQAFARFIETVVGSNHVGNSYTSFRYYKRIDGREIQNAEEHNGTVDKVFSTIWDISTFSIGFAASKSLGLADKLAGWLGKHAAVDFTNGLLSTVGGSLISDKIVGTLAEGFHIRDGGYVSHFIEYRTDYKFLGFIPMSHYGQYEIREYSQKDLYTGVTTFTYEVWFQYFDAFGNITPYQKIGEMTRHF